MKPIEFPQANTRLLPPEGQEEDVLPLPIWTDGNTVMSKWQLSIKERVWVLIRGTIYLHVIGRTHPPLAPIAESPWRKEARPWSGLKKLSVMLMASLAMWASIGFILWLVWSTYHVH